MQQVVLCATNAEGNISAWDLVTGTHLTAYKGNASNPNCACLLGSDHLLAAQNSKDALQIWTWHKDAATERCFVLERLSAVAASQDGAYVAGGGMSGSIYLWEAASGRLLKSWQAHYKGVTCLCFAERGCVLISGGQDTIATVWSLQEVLAHTGNQQVRPLHSWAEHTLPITSITCGSPGSASSSSLVITSSLDHSLRLWNLGGGQLLRTINLPTTVHCTALDVGEHCLYAGGGDGNIYEVSLVGPAPADLTAGESGANRLPYATFKGHSRQVSSLALSIDSELLVSGSEDGSVRVWDARSRQQIRLLVPEGKAAVSWVAVLKRPPFLTPSGGQAAQGGRNGPKRPSPVMSLAKYPANTKPLEGAPVVVDGRYTPASVTERSGLAALCSGNSLDAGSTAAGQHHTVSFQPSQNGHALDPHPTDEIDTLKRDLEAARALATKWQNMHKELQQLCVQHLPLMHDGLS